MLRKFISFKAKTNCPNILLGGSGALFEENLITRKPKDMDIVCSEKDLEFINLVRHLSKLYPSRSPSMGYYLPNNNISGCLEHIPFKWVDIDVCVFVTESNTFEQIKSLKRIGFVSTAHIIDAKKFYINTIPPTHPSHIKHSEDLKEISQKLGLQNL